MSDIKNLHRAYAAVYDSEIKENLKQSRDEISAMSLTQMNDVDLYEVAEEVLEEVFAKNSDIVEAEKLIEAVFIKASEGVESEGRADKIERLGEAFVSAFARVKEKSIRTAVESYSDYRRSKEIIANRNDDPNSDLSKVRLHNALVAEDRRVVKDGLLKMIESVGSAVDKTLSAVGDIAKVGGKAAVGTAKGAAGAVKLAGKVAKGTASAVGRIAGTPIGVAKAVKKGFKAGTTSEGYGDKSAGQILAKREKDDNAAGAPKQYTLTKADKTGNTVAWQNRNKKNVKTGEPLYKKADHLKNEELELANKLVESGKFSDVEIAKIADIQEADIADIIARLEKKRISKGGDPKESPLPALRKYHADKYKKK